MQSQNQRTPGSTSSKQTPWNTFQGLAPTLQFAGKICNPLLFFCLGLAPRRFPPMADQLDGSGPKISCQGNYGIGSRSFDRPYSDLSEEAHSSPLGQVSHLAKGAEFVAGNKTLEQDINSPFSALSQICPVGLMRLETMKPFPLPQNRSNVMEVRFGPDNPTPLSLVPKSRYTNSILNRCI